MKLIHPNVHIHSTADVSDDANLGDGTRVWHDAQIRERARLGANCIVGKGAYIDVDVTIGDNVKIQNRASIYHGTSLGEGVFVGPHVVFTNDRNPRAINSNGTLKIDDDWEVGEIRVKRGASIGASSVILPGITIGEFALIGAGSVVTRDVPDFTLVIGNPARAKGNVCACGHNLAFSSEQSTCSRCGSTYRVVTTYGDHALGIKVVRV